MRPRAALALVVATFTLACMGPCGSPSEQESAQGDLGGQGSRRIVLPPPGTPPPRRAVAPDDDELGALGLRPPGTGWESVEPKPGSTASFRVARSTQVGWSDATKAAAAAVAQLPCDGARNGVPQGTTWAGGCRLDDGRTVVLTVDDLGDGTVQWGVAMIGERRERLGEPR